MDIYEYDDAIQTIRQFLHDPLFFEITIEKKQEPIFKARIESWLVLRTAAPPWLLASDQLSIKKLHAEFQLLANQ